MRYAIYYCPDANSALGEFGHRWLRDAENVIGLPHQVVTRLLMDVRRYGWHATIRAPFALEKEHDFEDLVRCVSSTAQNLSPFDLSLKLDSLGGFPALRPASNENAPRALADAFLHALEPLRAPLSDKAFHQRAGKLDPRERELLQQFGYPYVLEKYRFHMTLCAPATRAEEDALRNWLTQQAASWSTTRIDSVSICMESEAGADFMEAARIPLGVQNVP